MGRVVTSVPDTNTVPLPFERVHLPPHSDLYLRSDASSSISSDDNEGPIDKDGRRIVRRLTRCVSRPFGCNAPGCSDQNGQLFAFDTTAELSRHWTIFHADHLPDLAKKFRCALPGCNRTYKNLNGLQYHAQTSIGPQGHASMVPSRGRPSKGLSEEIYQPPVITDGIDCPIPGCGKTYKQLAGLRYHCVRGHVPPPTFEELRALNPELAIKLQGRANALDKLRSEGSASSSSDSGSAVNARMISPSRDILPIPSPNSPNLNDPVMAAVDPDMREALLNLLRVRRGVR